MSRRDRQSAGISLVELLIVISLISILAGVVVPSTNPSIYGQLQSVAQTLSGDIGYARNLAVSNGSKYRITFDLVGNKYVLEHTGTSAPLDTLPYSPFRGASDPADQQIVRLAELPRVGATPRLQAAYALAGSPTTVTDLEFGPLGETTRSEETIIWLAAGTGSAARYLSIRVSPITGLCWIENFQADAPATATAAGTAAAAGS
jgi:type II secretory pathway pseudopilin PulG